MNKIKLFIFILSFGLVSFYSYAEDVEEEAVTPSNPQELLEIVSKVNLLILDNKETRELNFVMKKINKLNFFLMQKMKEQD